MGWRNMQFADDQIPCYEILYGIYTVIWHIHSYKYIQLKISSLASAPATDKKKT